MSNGHVYVLPVLVYDSMSVLKCNLHLFWFLLTSMCMCVYTGENIFLCVHIEKMQNFILCILTYLTDHNKWLVIKNFYVNSKILIFINSYFKFIVRFQFKKILNKMELTIAKAFWINKNGSKWTEKKWRKIYI